MEGHNTSSSQSLEIVEDKVLPEEEDVVGSLRRQAVPLGVHDQGGSAEKLLHTRAGRHGGQVPGNRRVRESWSILGSHPSNKQTNRIVTFNSITWPNENIYTF